MPGLVKLGCTGSGHASWPPTVTSSSASTVYCNGILACRQTDTLKSHSSPTPNPAHSRAISMGSTDVSIEGLPAARFGDSINCGGFLCECSGDTYVN